jgi:hypothetical protein
MKGIPNAELAVVPDSGHFALYSEREKVIPIVQHFLEKSDTRIPVPPREWVSTPVKPDKAADQYDKACYWHT